MHQINIQCKNLFGGSMRGPFSKVTSISDKYKYLDKMTLEYYSYFYLCYFPSANRFGYLFAKYVATKYIWIFFR